MDVVTSIATSRRQFAANPHPVSSAGRFAGRDADVPFLIEGSYLDAAPADWVADWGGVTMTSHREHRPLEAYSRALEATER
jgi:hypothetical protein